MRVLVIEDNQKISKGIETLLNDAGFEAVCVLSGIEGEDLAVATKFDAIILDLMLPDRDGLEVCRNLRRRKVATPVLVLSALADSTDKVLGLDAGADDYVAKPFKAEELMARLRAMCRRGEVAPGVQLKCDDLSLDLYTRRLTRAGQHWDLGSREYSLIEYLLRNQNRVLSRTQIGESVWDINFEPSSNVIDVYISALRKKIDRPDLKQLIHTVKNTGYRFGIME